MKHRLRVAAAYLAVTSAVALLVFLSVRFLWYPGALFGAAGGRELFLLVSGIDLVLGPLIVFILYKPGKKGLKFDLVAVGALQLAALCFGIWVLFESRPAFIVFVKDRFELARANEIADQEAAKARDPYRHAPLSGPRIVGAVMPSNPDEQFRVMMSAMSGLDLHTFPQHFVPYDDLKGEVMLKALPMARLRALNPGKGEEIDAIVKRHGKSDADLRFLPMRAGLATDLTVILDGVRAEVVEIVALRPWEYE